VISSILSYQSLDDSGSPISTSPILFAEQMAHLVDHGVPVVPLDQITVTPGAVALTFDGGYRNFLDFGLPVIEQFRLSATVFVVTGYCGDQNRWCSHKPHIPALPLMDWDQLAWLPKERVALGSQTVRHSVLPRLTEPDAIRQLEDSYNAIAHVTGVPPVAFAYPYGEVSESVSRLVHRRYPVACTDRLDFVTGTTDLQDLPRLNVHYLQDPGLLLETVQGNHRWHIGMQRMFGGFRAALRSA
jgi:peptidoglycan/xylan/chitin deacetylase (PgdA/CDA1 family)